MTIKPQDVIASPDKKEAPVCETGAVIQVVNNIVANETNIKSTAEFDLINFLEMVTGVQDGQFVGIGRMEDGRLIRENGTIEESGALITDTSIMDGNFWFCTSALKSEDGQRRDDCACTKSIIVDLDYGTTGHQKTSYFATEEEALNCLRQLPISPSIVWNTGHGLQAAFFLDQPVFYSDKDRCAEFEKAKAYIYSATHSDSTQSPEHLFRVPGSMNVKPGCSPVRTRIIEL